MMDAAHLRLHVVRPVLRHLDLWSEAAEALVMGTAAHESDGFRYLRQIGGGPARGLWQCEPDTHEDIWLNFLAYHPTLGRNVRSFRSGDHDAVVQLAWNLAYGAAICRVHYHRFERAGRLDLPTATDVAGLARAWKRFYNTPAGAGTEHQFVDHFHRYVGV